MRLHIPILYHLGDCNGQWASRTRRPETTVHTYSQSYTRTVIHTYSVLAFSSHRTNEPFHSFFGFDFQLSPSVLELNLSLTKNN